MICLKTDVAGGIILSGLPQCGQKLAEEGTNVLQAEHTTPGSVAGSWMRPVSTTIPSLLSAAEDTMKAIS